MKNVYMYQKGKDWLYKTWHGHDFGEFLYVHSGEGQIVFADKIYPIKKGAVCFIPPNKQHYTIPENFENYVRSKIEISNGLLLKILALGDVFDYSLSNAAVYAEIPQKEQIAAEKLFDLLSNAETRDSSGFFSLYSSCVMMLLAYLKNYKKESTPVRDNFIIKAIVYINNHISEPIGIDDICGFINVSKYYFCHSFKKAVGMSVMSYILKTRLSMAAQMLCGDKKSIGEIAADCGFKSSSDFCHSFKKHMGQTALQYKKALTVAPKT